MTVQRAVADDDAAHAGLDGEALGLVAVGDQDDVAGLDVALHHLRRGSDADAALLDAALRVAGHHLAVQGVEDVGVARLAAGEDRGVEDVHVGAGDVLDGDQALDVVVGVGDDQGVDLGLLDEVPRDVEARLGVDAGLVLEADVLDLRGDARDERGLVEAEVPEGELRLAVDRAGATCLVDGLVDLVLEIGVADCGTDRVRVRMQVAYDVYLADCVWHVHSLVRIGCRR